MKSFQNIAIVALSVLTTLSPQAAKADLYDLGLAMTIQYFGAETGTPQKIIGYGPNPSPEYKFMGGLAFALQDKAPAMLRILSPEYSAEMTPLKDSHLALGASIQDPSAQQALTELLIGCPYDEELSQSFNNLDPSPAVKTRIDTYSLQTSSSYPNARVCMNSAVSKLNELGFSEIQVQKVTGSNEVTIVLAAPGQSQNMMYLQKQLTGIRGVGSFSATLKPVGGTGNVRAYDNGQVEGVESFQFVGDQSTHTIGSPVAFTYKFSWGDCESGCEYSHTWNVNATPHADASGSYTFDLAITESGTALSQ